MLARLAVLPRVLVVVLVLCAATVAATVTFAATRPQPAPPAAASPAAPAAPAELVVPDVRKQAYVFAKGTLEDAGFAWRVTGRVEGYAANLVVGQSPVAGTRVVDTGAPTIALVLARNPSYGQEGEPENASPYAGSAVRLVAAPLRPAAPAEPAKAKPAVKTKPAVKAKPVAKAKPITKAKPATKPSAKSKPETRRTPAFLVPGAPQEPLDEITLAARARQLDRWLATHRSPTDANVQHWLYQHSWIVTGARFGWSHGAEALRILVAVDRKVEARWGVGSRSRAVAEAALAHVQARAR